MAVCDDGSYDLFTFSSDGTCDLVRDEYYLDWGDDEHFFNRCFEWTVVQCLKFWNYTRTVILQSCTIGNYIGKHVLLSFIQCSYYMRHLFGFVIFLHPFYNPCLWISFAHFILYPLHTLVDVKQVCFTCNSYVIYVSIHLYVLFSIHFLM